MAPEHRSLPYVHPSDASRECTTCTFTCTTCIQLFPLFFETAYCE